LIGLVTTNAPIYWGGAPIFQDGSLNYQVAGLHLKADGTLFKGSYDLAIRSEVARCLYGFSNAPIMANVSVLSTEGEGQLVATELVTEKDGWITLNAKNFTFSSPTIKVKLSQAGSAPRATPKEAKKSSAAPITKKTIACVKGKTIKKVTGNNPSCPKGYTKI